MKATEYENQSQPGFREEVASREEEVASRDLEDFFPRGAIAFFVSLILGFGLIWAGLFYLMVQRQFHP